MTDLTIDGYTFENHPSTWQKSIQLPTNPERHFKRILPSTFVSDGYKMTVQFSGDLAINESSDRDELNQIQQKQIDGEEVSFSFDPFVSGQGVITGDPFTEQTGRGTYSFSINMNTESTGSTDDFPSHATPNVGETFTFAGFDFGFDPETLNQSYGRDSATVEKITGPSQTVDNDGLIVTATLDGYTDGAGQHQLWEQAKKNAISYLQSEFQSGWALIRSLSITNEEATPDPLYGLYRYDVDFLILRDRSKDIVQPAKAVNTSVERSGTYVSDKTVGTLTDDGLTVTIDEGTGAVNGSYVVFPETDVTLTDNATNYIYVEDSDGDGYGDVKSNTSGFPSDTIPLWDITTSNGAVDSSTDKRAKLIAISQSTGADLLFKDRLSLTDKDIQLLRALSLSDTIGLMDQPVDLTGVVMFSDTIVVADADPVFKRIVTLSDGISLNENTTWTAKPAIYDLSGHEYEGGGFVGKFEN